MNRAQDAARRAGPVPAARSLAVALAVALALGGCAGTRSLMSGRGTQPSTHLREDAAASFDAGVQAYQRGELPRALAAFERAFAIEPAPAVLYNLARVHDSLGHSAAAARFYLAYVCGAASLSPDEQREISDALTRLAPRVGWIVVRSPRPTTVDGETLPTGLHDEGLAVPFAVTPGPRAVRVEGREPVVARLRAGEVLTLDFVAEDHGTPSVMVSTSTLAELHLGDFVRAVGAVGLAVR